MLPSTSPREVLLACTPSPPGNLPSFIVESTLSFSCSGSDPFFLDKVRLLLTFTLSHLMTWCSGQTALFLFILVKASLAYLPTALSVALRPLSPFQQVQYAQVFPLKTAPLSKLFADLGSTNKSCHFSSLLLLSDSRSVLITLFSPPSFLLPQFSGISGRNCLLFPLVLSGCNESPDTCFFQETTQLMSWPDGEHYSCHLQSFVVFSSYLSYPLITFLRLEACCTVLSKFFNTQVPLVSTKELVLPCHACCVLSHLCFNGQSLLQSPYLSRIGRIKNPSCSTCGHSSQDTSHLILHCPATDSLRRLLLGSSLSSLVQALESFLSSGALWSSAMPPIPQKGSGNHNIE